MWCQYMWNKIQKETHFFFLIRRKREMNTASKQENGLLPCGLWCDRSYDQMIDFIFRSHAVAVCCWCLSIFLKIYFSKNKVLHPSQRIYSNIIQITSNLEIWKCDGNLKYCIYIYIRNNEKNCQNKIEIETEEKEEGGEEEEEATLGKFFNDGIICKCDLPHRTAMH